MYSCWNRGVGEGQGELGKNIFPAGGPVRGESNISNGDKLSLLTFKCRRQNKENGRQI